MREKIIKIFFIFCVLVLGCVIACMKASPALAALKNEQDCLNKSGGREDIASVKWACRVKNYSVYDNVCTLWIGGDDSVNPTIYVNSLSGNITIRYYGMCTDATNKTKRIWVKNDNGSIDDTDVELNRGLWNAPTNITTKLNVGKFVSGITPTTTSDGNKKYVRTVTVGRQNGESNSCSDQNGNACSEMEEKVIVIYRQRTLTAKGKINDVEVSEWGDLDSDAVGKGSSASVTVPKNKTKDGAPYVFWKYGSSCNNETSRKCTINPLNNNKTVYAHYKLEKRTLSGEAVVVDGASCKNFSAYNPESSTVDWGASAFITARDDHSSLIFEGWRTTKCTGVVKGGKTYSVNPLKNNTTVYAIYRPKPLPCDGTCSSSIDIVQSRNDSNAWTKDVIYAKPNDVIKLKGAFRPGYQQVYNPTEYGHMPDKAKFVHDASYTDRSGNFSNIVDFYNKRYVDYGWNNAFSIVAGKNDEGWCYGSYNGLPGFNDEIGGETQYTTEVGTSWYATASTNLCKDAMMTPWKIQFSYNSNYDLRAVIDDDTRNSDKVMTYVPYNFENSTKIKDDSGIVYAGEEKTVEYGVEIGARNNGLVGENYATKAPVVKTKLQWKYNGGEYSEVLNIDRFSFDGGLNINNNSDGESNGHSYTINVEDLPAGSKMWVRSCVYPASSGAFSNWQDEEGDHEWACSSDVEYTIAKKPSFQVWGGNVYSAKDIETSVANKHMIDGEVRSFGSWTELGLMANGTVTGMASGAGLGYNRGDKGGNSFCLRSTLTFANEGCENSAGFKGAGSIDSGEDRHNLISDFVQEGDEFIVSSGAPLDLSIDDENHKTDEGVYYYYRDGEMYLGALSGINSGTTKVIDTKGNITIANNIEYKDKEGGNTALTDIPKVILYASGNIIIQCHVNRVDAVLIAGGDIKTCNNDDENEERNSNQLKINGATVSNTLTLNRTYGAATVFNSIIPAEIINYDTSLYLWANGKSNVAQTGKIVTAYQVELSPRY